MSRRMLATITMMTLCSLGASSLWAQPVITVCPKTDGGWEFSIGAGNIPGGPGGNVTGDFESPADMETLTISNCNGSSDSWRIDIKKLETDWDGDLVISARVRSSGSGEGTVSAPDSYRAITAVSQPFLSGTGNRTGITIQLKVSGISVSRIHAGRYLADLVYTVTDTE